jgi:outer membrane biosynthesis protein TonB
MAKHEKQKAGLHKGISSIFKGVSIPQADGDQEPSGTSAPERTDYTKPKPLVPVLQKSEVTKAYQATQTLPKAAPGHTAPEPQKTQAQKSYQVTPSLPKAATAQQSKAEPVQKPKAEPVQKPKAEPTRQPKADIDKKVSKKSPTVKISSQSFLQQIKNKLFKPKSGVSTSTTKQKAMVVMMPLLFIVLIFMLSRGGVFGTSAGRTEASTEDTAPGVVTAGAYTKIDWEIPAPYPTTLRDPMRLVPVEIPQTEISKTLKLIVKGILYSEDNPSAVIGNQIVHEGETIRGVSVIKISQDSVEFEMNGKRWTQKIRQ